MARTAKTLTLAQIKKLPAGLHAVGGPVPGLCVAVLATGRAWRLRRWVDGAQRTFDLGATTADASLEKARELAAALVASLEVNAQAEAAEPEPAPVRAPRAPERGDNPFLGPIALELIALAAG